jgi:hypothetical protein
MIARRAIDRIVGHLSECYVRAGIGPLKSTGGRGEKLKDTPLFGPQDYLAVFRYVIGDPERSLSLAVAVNVELAGAISRHPATLREPAGSARVKRLAAALPVKAVIVLGGWSVPLFELAALVPGDEIVLPEGEDARMEVEGVQFRCLRIEVAEGSLRAHLREATNATR